MNKHVNKVRKATGRAEAITAGRQQNKLVRLIALQYAARNCKQNKRYHTSARLTLAYNRKRKFNYFGCALVRRF